MVIYLDILLFVGALTNYLLLLCTALCCRMPVSRTRLGLAAAFGAAHSLLTLLPPLSPLLLAAVRGTALALCCRIAFGPLRRRQFLQSLLVLWLCSTALAGLLLLLAQRRGGILVANGSFYADISPLLLTLTAALLYLLLGVLQRRHPELWQQSRGALRFAAEPEPICCSCLIDSGNTLTEPISGQPVLLVRRRFAASLLSPSELAACDGVLSGGVPPACPTLRLIPCSTVAGAELLPGFPLGFDAALCPTGGKPHTLLRPVVAFVPDNRLPDCDALAYPPNWTEAPR